MMKIDSNKTPQAIRSIDDNMGLHKKLVNKSSQSTAEFNEQLKDASQDLEAYFLQTLMKEFRDNPFGEDLLFPSSMELDIYKDFHDQAVAENMAKAGGIGLGKFVYEQMKREDKATLEHLQKFQKKI